MMTEKEYILIVCKNIKSLRIEKNMTQLELSSKIGIDDSSLRRIESGRTSPTLKTLYRIAISLNVQIHDILPTHDLETI